MRNLLDSTFALPEPLSTPVAEAVLPLTEPHAKPVRAGGVRRHICFVAPQAWPVLSRDPNIAVVGGAEVQQSILARLLVRAGYRVSMICLDYGQPAEIVVDGIRVFKAHREAAGVPGLRFVHPRLTSMWRTMRRVNADIYYQRSADMLTAVVAAFCQRNGKRSIYAGASDTDFIPGRQVIRFRRDRWLFERGLANVDAVIVQNEKQKADCLKYYGRTSTLIPSCYELPPESRSGKGDLVLWVATFRPDKCPELLLDLARRLPHLRFVLIGGFSRDQGGPGYYEQIRQAASELPNVELTGFLPLAKAEAYFDRAAVVVNTSRYEGMPNTFLQAWARGIPTVAFIDVGARLKGEPVYHVANGVDDAAAEIKRLCGDPVHRSRASARCRAYFERTHGSDAVLTRFLRVVDSLGRENEG